MKAPCKHSIALYGTNPLSLVLGRACALREHPLREVYESDPQAALRASLYLGVSARSTSSEILASDATLVLASELPPREMLESSSRVLLLRRPSDDTSTAGLTWLDSTEGLDFERELTTISSTPPELSFKLIGPDSRELADFLNQLSDSFTATVLD